MLDKVRSLSEGKPVFFGDRENNVNENLQTRINGEITRTLIYDKSGKPTLLVITSSKSASLPSSQLIQEIKIKDDQQGIAIQYQQGPLTEKAVEQILNWLASKVEIRLDYTAPEPKDRPFIFIERIHFKSNYPGEIHIKKVSLEEAHKHTSDQLAETNILSIKSPLHVKEAKVTPIPEKAKPPVLPLVGLHQALEEAGAYEKIKREKNREVLKAYLTTDKPMGDLKETADVKSVDAVHSIIHRNLHKIFEYLPPDVQEQYGGSANEAIKRKASAQLQTHLSKERIKKGVAGKERIYTKPKGRPKGIIEKNPRQYKEKTGRPKGRADSQPRKTRELSDTHKQNWSRSSTHSHQEQEGQQRTPTNEEHTIVDLTKPSQER